VASQCLFRQAVETACLGVGLDLLVPHIGVEFGEPLGELGNLGPGEAGDVLFDFLELGHAEGISTE
jgi:hypothetical protein